MIQDFSLLDRFEAERPRLRALAYRMLGSSAEADDAVQEAWLRFDRTDLSEMENLAAWLTTVVSRVCLNLLRARQARREESLESFTPDWLRRGRRAGMTEIRAKPAMGWSWPPHETRHPWGDCAQRLADSLTATKKIPESRKSVPG